MSCELQSLSRRQLRSQSHLLVGTPSPIGCDEKVEGLSVGASICPTRCTLFFSHIKSGSLRIVTSGEPSLDEVAAMESLAGVAMLVRNAP